MKAINIQKISLLAVLTAGASACCAQVTISGSVDLQLRGDSGNTSGSMIKSVSPGTARSSRLIISAIEDLGGGFKAVGYLEGGLNADDGAGSSNPPGVSGFNFGRLSFVGLGSDSTGYLTLGRQYNPIWSVSAGPMTDPFAAAYTGGILNFYNTTTRSSNAIVYSYGYTVEATKLPAPAKGLGVLVNYSLGEGAAPNPQNSGRQAGFNVTYGDGTWFAGYAYHRIDGSNTTISATAPVSDKPRLTQQTLAGSYVIGGVRLHLGLNTGRNDASGATRLDKKNWHVGMTAPITDRFKILALYGKADDRTAANKDFTTTQIAALYDLSRRTQLYAGVGVGDNNQKSNYVIPGALGTYALGATSRSVLMGMRHNF